MVAQACNPSLKWQYSESETRAYLKKEKRKKKSLYKECWVLVAMSFDKIRKEKGGGLGLVKNEPLKPTNFFIL